MSPQAQANKRRSIHRVGVGHFLGITGAVGCGDSELRVPDRLRRDDPLAVCESAGAGQNPGQRVATAIARFHRLIGFVGRAIGRSGDRSRRIRLVDVDASDGRQIALLTGCVIAATRCALSGAFARQHDAAHTL